jgi:uncharacterized protein (TIGR03437 family)
MHIVSRQLFGLCFLIHITNGLVEAQECRLVSLSPAQPPNRVEEGERATESQTFQSAVSAVAPNGLFHFFDATNRIRRMESSGRLTTVAGNAQRAELLSGGAALATALPTVSQLSFSPSGVLHFTALGRVWRVAGGVIEAVAGSGRPGFNLEAGAALDVNLGGIVNITFERNGALLIVDGFNRVRRVDGSGQLRTIAGSTRAAATNGLTGDEGPAVEAALSSPRQVFVLADGTLWVRDLTGRHLRHIDANGIIRTIQTNFDTNISILALPNGAPHAATNNRLLPIRLNGQLETAANPYPPFTGIPRAVGPEGAFYFQGGDRPEQRNALVRVMSNTQRVVAAAPSIATIDAQAPPFGVWRNGALLYSTASGGKAGIVEARPGQTARFIAGGGDDIGDAEGKTATNLTLFGVQTFTIDGAGRIVIADVYRQRILVVESDGKVNVLKEQGGEAVRYAPLGALSTLQRITADAAGNIYWYTQGATPTGGVFTADVAVWTRASGRVSTFTVVGLNALLRLEDGSAAMIAGNATNFRSLYRISPAGQGDIVSELRFLPLLSATRLGDKPYFIAASRVFRGAPGTIEYLNLPFLPSGTALTPDFVLANGENVFVHLVSDSGFYRLENPNACEWIQQPLISNNGIVNAASFDRANTVSPRQLITVFGRGFGPPEGQGLILDGLLRAASQPAPYPALVLGNFSGTIPFATLTGSTLPVVYSNDKQVTVQGATTNPAGGTYLLYYSWQGLQLIHPTTIRTATATPGIFNAVLNADGALNSRSNGAAPGTQIQLYATGLGAIDTNPALGEFFSVSNLTRTTNAVSAEVAGAEAAVLFAGGAPGLIGGVYQVNVELPAELAPGEQTLTLSVAGQTARISVYVK